jgi:hypothetical protein
MSWAELDAVAANLPDVDSVNGPTNPQSRLRLFGQAEDTVRCPLPSALCFLPFL